MNDSVICVMVFSQILISICLIHYLHFRYNVFLPFFPSSRYGLKTAIPHYLGITPIVYVVIHLTLVSTFSNGWPIRNTVPTTVYALPMILQPSKMVGDIPSLYIFTSFVGFQYFSKVPLVADLYLWCKQSIQKI